MQKVDSYARAYVEILEIVNNMGEEYRKRVPVNLLNFFEENKDLNYTYNLNELSNNGTNVFSNETIGLLAMIESKYWANSNEKELLSKALIENEKRYQDEIMEKYNPDNIFKNSNDAKIQENEKITYEEENNETKLVKVEDNIFVRFIKKIKNVFKIK